MTFKSRIAAASSMLLTDHDAPGPRRFRGRWLIATRAIWLAILAISVIQVLFATPVEFALYAQPCGADCGGSLLSLASARQLQGLGVSMSAWALYAVGLELFFAGAWGTVACLIFWRKGDEPLAWLVSLTLLAFGHAFPGFTQALWYADHNRFWMLMAAPVLFIAVSGIVGFFYIFPDGRFVPRWTRWLSVAWAIYTAYTLYTTNLDGTELYFNLYYVGLALGVGSQIYRYRRVADQLQKQQTKWVVFGVSVAMFIFLGLNVANLLGAGMWRGRLLVVFLGQTLIYLGMTLIPFSIDMAIFRSRLWDIDIIIGRTLVYGALTLCIVGIYVVLVSYLGMLFRNEGNLLISLATTGLVAVLFQPLRAWLQRGVNRLVYGERDDPYAAISRLGQRLETTLAPEAVLPAIVETVAQTLRLPYVAIALLNDERETPNDEFGRRPAASQRSVFEIVAAYGELPPQSHFSAPAQTLTLPLTYQGETLGQIILGARAPGESFTPADRRLLGDLARQAGVAAHTVRLTAALQRSRERLVAAREEERRRLRRDLHDGLGPQLASLTLKLDAARNMLPREPAASKQIVDELKVQTQAAIADIRRLVYALRPPALDDLGLVGALRQYARQLEQGGLLIVVVADELPPLPAAVEVAAYRIAQEALTNIVKHAGACGCRVAIALSRDALELTIEDDGCGVAADRPIGIGTESMAERAAELGGVCRVVAAPGGGTCVSARLPLPLAVAALGAAS